MKYLIDTNDMNKIAQWSRMLEGSFHGVTTNNLMLKTTTEKIEFMKKNYNLLFLQVESPREFDLIEKAWDESEWISGKPKPVIKIPMTKNNTYIYEHAKNFGFKVAATTCYDIVQINQAIEMGLNYSMVYYAKNPNQNLLEEAMNLKEKKNSDIKVVAASFRTKADVEFAINSGIEYATIRPEVLELAFRNLNVLEDIND